MERKKTLWSYGQEIISTLWRRPPQKYGNSYFYAAGFNPWKELDYITAYETIPELNAVVSTKARMFGNGVIKEVNDNGEEVQNSRLVALLANPNWFQGGKEFMRQTKLFRELFGNEYIYTHVPVGVDIERAKRRGLFTIPSNWMKVSYNDKLPFFMHTEQPDTVKYEVEYEGYEQTIDSEYLLHLNDDRVNMTNKGVYSTADSLLKGQSRLQALTPALNNIKMAYETRGVILKNRGALGILSNATSDKVGAIPLDPDEKERVQNEYLKYGGLSGQMQLIVTSADLRWQQMSISPDKLGLYRETQEDFNKILDSYGMPSELFVRDKGATHENQNEARKGAYVDTIIPEANEWIGAFNRKFREGAKTKLIVDYLHLPIFQEDMKKRGESLSSTINALSKAFQDQALSIEQYKSELQKFNIK